MQPGTTNKTHLTFWIQGACQAGLILLVALVPAVLSGWMHPRRPSWSQDQSRVPEVEWTTIQQLHSRVLLIDARGSAEFEREHIPGALWLGTRPGDEEMVAVARAWQPGTRLVVYCDNPRCDAAQAGALRLERELGLKDVAVLKGGWSAWTEAQKLHR
jgi:rhodanese-related sulfurtransferase